MKMTAMDLVILMMVFYTTCMQFATTEVTIKIMTDDEQIMVEREEATFYCLLKSKDIVETKDWKWKKDEQIIERNQVANYQVQLLEEVPMLKLIIKKVKVEDANYNFQCCLGVGEEEECKGLALPPILEVPHDTYPTCQLNKNPATAGEQATVECCCEVINPMPLLSWVGISSSNVNRYTRDQVQCITHTFMVERHHEEGTMICQMTMNVTKKIQRNCTSGKIQVLYKPQVTLQADIPFQVDTEVVLICFAEADPANKQYKWSFDRQLHNKVMKENGMVIHLMFSPSDEGIVITCEVENSIGKGKANLTVSIATTQPTAKAPPGQGTLHVNTPATITQDSTILAIVGVSLLFVSFLIAAALCYFVLLTPTPRHPLDYTGGLIPQPDIYFEPKDNILGSSTSTGQRHVGIQVPSRPDSEPFYMEVPGSDKGSQSHYATSRSVYV